PRVVPLTAKQSAGNDRGKRSKVMRLGIFLASFIGASMGAVHAQQSEPTTVPVGTVAASKRPIAESIDFVGRVEAINRVDFRARITGYLEEVLFKEGDLVKEGAPLYRIERGMFQAAVEQAQGALEKSKANKILTAVQRKRAEELAQRQTGTLVARDQA